MLALSIVSHRQAALVRELLEDIAARVTLPLSVTVTVNVPEPPAFDAGRFPFPIDVVHNALPKGFGANHNAAFRRCRAPFFCILNPDVRLPEDPFPALLAGLRRAPRIGLIAPLIRNPGGGVEVTSRRFPTPAFILRKALLGQPRTPDYRIDRGGAISPDWVGGMFMLLRSEVFAGIGGFDEGYFMYYEDVDLCARLRRAGFEVVLDPAADAVHAARRDSHRRPRYLLWHLRSMLRFWRSAAYAALRRRSSADSSSPQTKNENTPG
jgi:N-acetylglucosaminyl-diphospho-decaprenol L-rhamnosyltransferase